MRSDTTEQSLTVAGLFAGIERTRFIVEVLRRPLQAN
jgi:hypothetical protein